MTENQQEKIIEKVKKCPETLTKEEREYIISVITDPLQEFCIRESKFRLVEFHNIPEKQVNKFADDVTEIIRDCIDYNENLYDQIDNSIREYIEDLSVNTLIEKTFDSYEVILEGFNGSYSFGLQDNDLLKCMTDAQNKYNSENHLNVYVDGCFADGEENICIWCNGEYEDENNIKENIFKYYKEVNKKEVM